MRIISGKYKGKRLQAPKNLPVRPTTDMAKEALFNILNNNYHISDVSVLDLFSGTGNISYEFCSRGNENITAVDTNLGCIKYINKTSDELQFNIRTIKADVFKFLETTPEKFDIIFADPPYEFEQEKFQKIVDIVFERGILNEEGMLIIEHSKFTSFDETYLFSQKKYGGNMFSFFEYLSEE